MNSNRYSPAPGPPAGAAVMSICAGRFVPVFVSSNMEVGATCECRRLHSAYALAIPSQRAASSSPPVRTSSPLMPMTVAVPVSWQEGNTPSAEMAAFFRRAAATNLSLTDEPGSSRMAAHCSRWAERKRKFTSRKASNASWTRTAGSIRRTRRAAQCSTAIGPKPRGGPGVGSMRRKAAEPDLKQGSRRRDRFTATRLLRG
jgi:hypothetical protein